MLKLEDPEALRKGLHPRFAVIVENVNDIVEIIGLLDLALERKADTLEQDLALGYVEPTEHEHLESQANALAHAISILSACTTTYRRPEFVLAEALEAAAERYKDI